VSFSEAGGVEIEANWDKVKSVTLPTGAPASGAALAPLTSGLPLELRPAMEAFLQACYAVRGPAARAAPRPDAAAGASGSACALCLRNPPSPQCLAGGLGGARGGSGRRCSLFQAGARGGARVRAWARRAERRGARQVFLDLDFTLLEMNPFTLDGAGAPFPLDMRGELDDTAAFKSGKKCARGLPPACVPMGAACDQGTMPRGAWRVRANTAGPSSGSRVSQRPSHRVHTTAPLSLRAPAPVRAAPGAYKPLGARRPRPRDPSVELSGPAARRARAGGATSSSRCRSGAR